MGITLLKLSDVKEKTQLSKSTIYKWIDAGKFPAPKKLGDRCVRWASTDIDEWIMSLADADFAVSKQNSENNCAVQRDEASDAPFSETL